MDPRTKASKLRSYLDTILPAGGLESTMEGIGLTAPPSGIDERSWEHAGRGIEKLARDGVPDEEEFRVLEAIVLPRNRPVFFIQDGMYGETTDPWIHLSESAVRNRLRGVLASVGRVEVPEHPSLPYAGTGFVVGEGLVMTNRHVARLFSNGLGLRNLDFVEGQSAEVDFRREHERSQRHRLGVRRVVMIHPYWDMALLQVESEESPMPAPIQLLVREPDDLRGSDVVVIGYPAFDWRNDAELQHEVFGGIYNVKRIQPGKANGRRRITSGSLSLSTLAHDSSTLGGNSGSAVVHVETGTVVGLHFAGRYLESNYAVPSWEMALDPRIRDAGVAFSGPAPAAAPPDWLDRWNGADPDDESRPAPPPAGSSRRVARSTEPSDVASARPVVSDGSTSIVLPLHVTFRLGALGSLGLSHAHGDVVLGEFAELGEAPAAYKIQPRPDYERRPGYERAFLGDDHPVDLPRLTPAQFADVARNRTASSQRHVLPYHHFSVIMCRSRRMAFCTAVNIDGDREISFDRGKFKDRWFYDPRLLRKEQLGEDLYFDNPLDRGHLVRRLDPCWGTNREEGSAAHDDTFHWTNCSPQHSNFNQNKATWQGLENYILDNANVRDLRVTVLTGPVFRRDDPVFRTEGGDRVQLPLDFWKVVAFVRDDGSLSATAYVVTQRKLVADLDGLEESFAYGRYKTFQTTIRRLERLTELSFGGLAAHDPMGGDEEGTDAGPRELGSFGDIVL